MAANHEAEAQRIKDCLGKIQATSVVQQAAALCERDLGRQSSALDEAVASPPGGVNELVGVTPAG
jgi:hypothetical protein